MSNCNEIQVQYEVTKTDFGVSTTNRPVTATLYVSLNGDNSDGSSWAKAYTNVADALAASDATGLTLWLVDVGTYDVDLDGGLSMGTKKISVLGTGLATLFTNTHATATYIFKSETYFEISNCQLVKDANIDGIVTHGADSVYIIHETVFDNTSVGGGTESAIKLEHGVLHDIRNIVVSGVVAETTGLNICGGKWVALENVRLFSCLKGIHVNGAASDQNEFKDFRIWDCATGIDIDAGDNQLFRGIKFINNTTNVSDVVGNHFWKDIKSDTIQSYILPADLTGTNVLAGGAGVYGADTQLVAAGAITNPFRIVAVSYEFDAVENYGLGISVDAGSTFAFETVLETWAVDECHRFNIPDLVSSQIFNEGTRVSAKLKSETGGNNAKVWLQIVEI